MVVSHNQYNVTIVKPKNVHDEEKNHGCASETLLDSSLLHVF